MRRQLLQPFQLFIGATLLVAGTLAAPGAVWAYGTPTVFEDDPASGGGGGRYFTGTVRDRYTCDVCHVGPDGPQVTVEGLPDGPLAWGQTYEISIALDAASGSVAAVAEIVELQGVGIGTIELPPTDELEPGELCASGLPAATIYDSPGRSVVTLSKCGADRLRFLWTAPEVPTTAATLHVSAVLADDDKTPQGDASLAAEFELEAPPEPEPLEAACNVGRSSPWALAWLLPVFFARGRSRRKQCRSD